MHAQSIGTFQHMVLTTNHKYKTKAEEAHCNRLMQMLHEATTASVCTDCLMLHNNSQFMVNIMIDSYTNIPGDAFAEAQSGHPT